MDVPGNPIKLKPWIVVRRDPPFSFQTVFNTGKHRFYAGEKIVLNISIFEFKAKILKICNVVIVNVLFDVFEILEWIDFLFVD